METIRLKDGDHGMRERALRKNGGSLFVLLFFAALCLGGCHPGSIYEQSVVLPQEGWHRDSALLFEPVIEDTSQVLNFGFSLTHNNYYPYSNLWLFVEVNSPGGQQQVDTLEYFLARPDGEWMGKGGDSNRKLYWLYKANVKMSQPGTYLFKVYQGMRCDRLEGVGEVSFWVENSKTD